MATVDSAIAEKVLALAEEMHTELRRAGDRLQAERALVVEVLAQAQILICTYVPLAERQAYIQALEAYLER